MTQRAGIRRGPLYAGGRQDDVLKRLLIACTCVLVVCAALIAVAIVRPRLDQGPDLPSGEIVTKWDLPIEDNWVEGYDEESQSIALKDYGTGGERAFVSVADGVQGYIRWRRQIDANWLGGQDGKLAVTSTGIGFLLPAGLRASLVLEAVRLSDGHRVWDLSAQAGWAPHLIDESIVVHATDTVTAFDGSTRAQLWSWPLPGDCHSLDVAYGAPTLIIPWCDSEIYSIDAESGNSSWRWSVGSGCKIRDVAADGGIVAAVTSCGNSEEELRVLNAHSGADAWRHAIPWNARLADPLDPGEGTASVSITSGIVSTYDSRNQSEIYTLSGRPVELDDGPADRRVIGVVNGHLLYRQDTPSGVVVGSVDADTGTLAWKRSIGLSFLSATQYSQPVGTANGRLYMIGRINLIWPATVALLDLKTGTVALTALDSGAAELVGVDQTGTIFSRLGSYNHYRLVAMRVAGHSTGFLGGSVEAGSWPNACHLLTDAEWFAVFPGETFARRSERPEVADLTVPDAPQCRYLPSAIDGPEVIVGVVWVAANQQAADEAAENQRDVRDPLPVSLGGRPAWRWDDTNHGVDLAPRTRLSFAVGLCVVDVTLVGGSANLEAIAQSVADNLADVSVSPGCSASPARETP